MPHNACVCSQANRYVPRIHLLTAPSPGSTRPLELNICLSPSSQTCARPSHAHHGPSSCAKCRALLQNRLRGTQQQWCTCSPGGNHTASHTPAACTAHRPAAAPWRNHVCNTSGVSSKVSPAADLEHSSPSCMQQCKRGTADQRQVGAGRCIALHVPRCQATSWW